MTRLAAVVGAVLLVAPLSARPPDVAAGAIRAHVLFLADDALEGRSAGTRGYDLAARYVAAQLEALGLEPLGEDGGYLLPVPLRRAVLDEGGSKLAVVMGGTRREMALGADAVLLPNFRETAAKVSAPLVFAGYGVSAPALGHDDYAGLDVRGKAVAVLAGGPPGLDEEARRHYQGPVEKVRAAAAHGAVALVSVTTPAFEQALPWARMVALSRMQRLRWVGEQAADLQAVAVLGRAASEALFARGPRRLAEVLAQPRAPRGFVLPATLEATTASTHAEVRSANVAAVLRGTHPARAREHVVLSAHLDHLGQGPAEEGDAVYNGAMDNALGVAVLMEAARALAGGGPRSRSVVFLASTAEESGLLGADYFARHPPVPAESLVANVNLEGIGLLFPLREVVGVGSRVSSLGEDLEAAAREVGVRVGREQGPSGGLFERSDHYAFARQGIPALMVIAGSQAGDGGPEGAARQLAWMADHYHRPSDDVRQAIDYGAAARLGEVAAALVARVAGDTARPEWKRGSFAAAAFGGKG